MSAFIQFISQTPTTVLSIKAAKQQLKIEVDDDFDNDIIQDCIDAAVEEAENYINASIYQREYAIKCSEWLKNNYEIRKQKITAVKSITYKDVSGEDQALVVEDVVELQEIDKYVTVINYLDEENLPELITNKTDAVVINIIIGYEAGKVPKGMLQGIKLLMTENYNIRNNIESKGYRSTALRKLEPYKYYTKPLEQ